MKTAVYILIFFSCVAFILCGYNLFQVFTHPLEFKNEIVACSEEYELPPELIASIINVESSFKEKSKSNKEAIGLMQIKLTTANYLNDLNGKELITEDDLFKPEINVNYGCHYLRYLINKFENINTALASYNAGETRVRTWLKSGIYSTDGINLSYIPFEETRNYVEKINKNIKFYKKYFKS